MISPSHLRPTKIAQATSLYDLFTLRPRWDLGLNLPWFSPQLTTIMQKNYHTIVCQSEKYASARETHGCSRGMQLMWLPEMIINLTSRTPECDTQRQGWVHQWFMKHQIQSYKHSIFIFFTVVQSLHSTYISIKPSVKKWIVSQRQ